MSTDEEYFLAEHEYENERERIKLELGNSKPNLKSLIEMTDRLDRAKDRFVHAASNLTKTELISVKSVVKDRFGPKSELEIGPSNEYSRFLKAEVERQRERALRASDTSNRLNRLQEEMTELENRKSDLEIKIGEFRSSEATLVREQIDKYSQRFKEQTEMLEKLQSRLGGLSVKFETTEPGRLRRLKEKDELERAISRNLVLENKMRDEIFLMESDLWRRKQAVESLDRSLKAVEEEIDEVREFRMHALENANHENNSEILSSLDAEKLRLRTEIDKLRESRFRTRVTI
jgi:prefoldin subunit 5